MSAWDCGRWTWRGNRASRGKRGLGLAREGWAQADSLSSIDPPSHSESEEEAEKAE